MFTNKFHFTVLKNVIIEYIIREQNKITFKTGTIPITRITFI